MPLREEKLREDIARILSDLDKLRRDRKEAGEEREEIGEDIDTIATHVNELVREIGETGEDVEEIKEDVESIRQDVKESSEDVEEIKEDVEGIRKEVDETGEDVEDIKENVEDIKKEIDETGDDVEDIKEDIEEIKEDLSSLAKEVKKEGILSKVASRVIPDRFAIKDVAQQIVGAIVLSAPFVVTGEVWDLAHKLSATHLLAIITITLIFDVLLYYFAKFKDLEDKNPRLVALRVFSLLLVTYTTSAIVLTTFGIIGGVITDPVWAVKLIIMVGLFANIGAGTADLIK